MRVLRTPHQGFMADHDMIAYYPGWVTSAATIVNQTTTLGRLGVDRHLTELNGAGLPTETGSLFNPNRPGLGGWGFPSGAAVTTAEPTPDDTGYITNASVGFSIAFWHRAVSASTQVVLERSVTPAGGGTNAAVLQVVRREDCRFTVRLRNAALGWSEFTTVDVSSYGFFGFDLVSGTVRLYLDGVQNGSTATVTGGMSTVAATASSARWVIGGSIANLSSGTYGTPPTDLFKGDIGEIGFWRRALGPAKMRQIYAGCVKPWDDNVLFASENYKALTRVRIADSTGVYQDVSNIDGRNFLVSVERDKSVDDAVMQAKVSLRRRMGRLADLSPLGTGAEEPYNGLIALRRKVLIDRAFVPNDWVVQGWEWEPIFEGAIDSWSMSENTLDVVCSDKSSSLKDVFILETRPYNFSPNKSAETVQTEIIEDFEPAIHTGGGLATTIGYKNFGKPRVYSEAGTVSTPTFEGTGLMLRFNDVASGPVLDAVQAVSDQIGYATEFMYHEPWAEHRLTNYSPRRSKVIRHQTIRRVDTNEALVEFREPHGLNDGVPVTIMSSGVGTLNRSYSVASVMDFYRVVLRTDTATAIVSGASVGPSTGSVSFDYNFILGRENILELSPVASNVNNIRNHAIVRFNRNDSPVTLSVTGVDVFSSIMTIVLSEDVTALDPGGNGVAFTLSGGTGGSAQLNGSYSGYVNGPRTIVTDITVGAADGTYSTNLPTFSCVHLAFQEVVSTASTSLAEYGYLPVAVFEGTNLAINTPAEAARLADNLISDLANPTAELSITTKVRPFEQHDMLSLPADELKGRWSSVLPVAITGIREQYESGNCIAEYAVRYQRPSRGTRWAERIIVSPFRPAPPNAYIPDMVDQASRIRLDAANRFARQFNFNRTGPRRREMGLRHDQTVVWMSTASVGFIPNDSNRVGVFRGERFSIAAMGDGTDLTPGIPHYVRFGEMDIFGNISAITGMGAASSATVPSVVPRFADYTVGTAVSRASGVTRSFPVGDWSTATLPDENGGADAIGLSHDDYQLYSTTSFYFRVPCDGTWLCNHLSSWYGDPTKVGAADEWYMLAGWLHLRGGVTVGFHGENGVEGVGTTVPARLSASAAITCSSGDQLILMWKNASLSGLDLINATDDTDQPDYMLVSYALGNQR